MVVDPADHRHVHVDTLEVLGGEKATEPRPDDDDVMATADRGSHAFTVGSLGFPADHGRFCLRMNRWRSNARGHLRLARDG